MSGAICHFRELSNDDWRAGNGWKYIVNTANNPKAIKKRVQRNTRISIRMCNPSERQMTKMELGLKPHKLQKNSASHWRNRTWAVPKMPKTFEMGNKSELEEIPFTDE